MINSGIHSDEFSVIKDFQNLSPNNFFKIIPSNNGFMLSNPISYYLFWWAYWIAAYENLWIYEAIKIGSHLLSFLLVYKFATDYLPQDRSVILALAFLLYPLHESSTYVYMNIPYTLAPSLLMFAHYLIRRNKILSGLVVSFLGTFSYYVSPPYSFGLAMIFLIEKKVRKAAIFMLPGIIYLVFYLIFSYYFQDHERKLDTSLSFIELIKFFGLQIVSLIESFIGPSYFIKIYHSLSSLSLFSCLCALPIIWFLFKRKNIFSDSPNFPSSLFYGFFTIAILSCLMYSLTGLYIHSPFNLGNRGLIYGSLLFSLFIALLRINKVYVLFISLFFILPILGLSDHWKIWNIKQKEITENVSTNRELDALSPDQTILVQGNTFSKLGPFSHIEFFSMPWHVESVFSAKERGIQVLALNTYTLYSNNSFFDTKFNKIYPIKGDVFLYDSNKNTLRKVNSSELENIFLNKKSEVRHWIQLLKGTRMEEAIVILSPRLSYIFD